MYFPYVKKIIIDNCFTYQGLTVDATPDSASFKHIILTGKNGSGKTSILAGINSHLEAYRVKQQIPNAIANLTSSITINPTHPQIPIWEKEVAALKSVTLELSQAGQPQQPGNVFPYLAFDGLFYILSFFNANRKVEVAKVETVTKEETFLKSLGEKQSSEQFSKAFKQYLVNKKVYQAFSMMNSDTAGVESGDLFFSNLEKTFRSIFKDDALELIFTQENFEFYIKLNDARQVTFNQLSAGYSAFLSIIMDLVVRADLIRKVKNDYTFDPAGFLIIDEPETHLHLEMQYEILPLITALFPNIQLIVASHSPAVISSLKNTVVYDLTTKDLAANGIAGSSYSELMLNHFGLDNQFSPVADKIIAAIDIAYKKKDLIGLKDILVENEQYLTPSLRLEIESRIITLNSSQETND